MSPGCVGHETDAGNHLRKDCVGLQRFGARDFAGINSGSANVTGGVYEEVGLRLANVIEEDIEIGVVNGFAGQRNEEMLTPPQFGGEGLTDVTSCSEEEDHWVR